MKNLTDEQLIEAYINGNNDALEFLIQKYLKPVYNFTLKYIINNDDADDVTQEVFVKLWKNIGKFKSEYKFKTWLFTIAKNTSLDFLKKKKNIQFSDLENAQEEELNFVDNIISSEELPLEMIKKREEQIELQEAIDKLPLKYKTTLNFHYYDDLTFREIAKIMRESIDTVKTRNRRAIKFLRRIISN